MANVVTIQPPHHVIVYGVDDPLRDYPLLLKELQKLFGQTKAEAEAARRVAECRAPGTHAPDCECATL